ncbi:MAG: hypothetical protein HKN25_16715 [Pyrinomonadaceae bacterium]|nr:hypothetical protein [Pyrinomonadaceae bacterium]
MNQNTTVSFMRITKIVILCWLSMIGFDFFLHGGLMAGFYVQTSPFLLPPEKAFRLIPIGYLSFLLFAILLVWLMLGQNIRGWRGGLVFGLKLGALIWGSVVLGLMSISTASAGLLIGWFFGQTIELGIAGAFGGSALCGVRLTKLFFIVFVLLFLSLLLTLVLQNLGFAPSLRV